MPTESTAAVALMTAREALRIRAEESLEAQRDANNAQKAARKMGATTADYAAELSTARAADAARSYMRDAERDVERAVAAYEASIATTNEENHMEETTDTIPPGTLCDTCETALAVCFIDDEVSERGNYTCKGCDDAFCADRDHKCLHGEDCVRSDTCDKCSGQEAEETKRATYNDRTTAAFRSILTAIAAATDASVYGTVHTPGTYPGKAYDGAIMYVVGTERHGMLRAVYTPTVRTVCESLGCYVESVNCEVAAVFMTDAE